MLFKSTFILILSTLSAGTVVGQMKDNVQSVGESSKNLLDSVTAIAFTNWMTDSLKVTTWSDSLRTLVNLRYGPKRVEEQVDSLTNRGVTRQSIDSLRDSLNKKNIALLAEINGQQSSIQKKLTGRYNAWLGKALGKSKLDSAGPQSAALSSSTRLPSNQAEIPQAPGEFPSLNSADFGALELSPDLKQVAGEYAIPSTQQLGSMNIQIPNKGTLTKPYDNQIGEIKNGLKDPGRTAEDRVGQLAGVDEINKQAGTANELKNNEAMQVVDQLKGADSPEAILPAAVDHFAGKEVVLQQAMDQMAKYKEKYPSLPSIADVKKTWLPHNSLKGVPFRERFRLGINLGVKNAKDTLFLDWHPNASYRISGRFEAGLGIMYSLRVQTNHFGFDQSHPVWGTTLFVVAKTFKSLFVRVETDGTSVPKTSATDTNISRDWRWSFLSGIQTNFRIATQWIGNVQMLYNFDSSLKDKFPEQLVVRVGVQYKLKLK